MNTNPADKYEPPNAHAFTSCTLDFDRVRNWHEGRLDDCELAEALDTSPEMVNAILTNTRFRNAICALSDVGGTTRLLPANVRIGLAITCALHQNIGLPLDIAAEIIGQHWEICSSIARTLDFVPDRPEAGQQTVQDVPQDAEIDPLMWFTPYACETIPLAATDEYIHLIDGRMLRWERPQEDAFDLVNRLHNSSSDCNGVLVPAAARDAFLECLVMLKREPQRRGQWLGRVQDGSYRANPPPVSVVRPAMASTVEQDCGGRASSYRSLTSVNISLAARAMKRRALGLDVVFP
ncbi:MAG: hypothetical protein ACRECW_09430 [Phyllobacterium sp.]